MPAPAVRTLLVLAVAGALLAAPAAAEDAPPMPPLDNVDTTTPPPGAPVTDDIGLPPPPPDMGELPPELPELPPVPTVPCYAGGGPLVLRTSPLYAKISPISSVTLSGRLLQDGRVCQAGLPVRLYARGPGATTFHLSRTLTTGEQGLVRTTYVRPRADFRWYLRSVTDIGAVQGATALVQVR